MMVLHGLSRSLLLPPAIHQRMFVSSSAQRRPCEAASRALSERLTALNGLVEAFAKADIDQQSAIQTYQQLSAQQTADIEALRTWYTSAAALSKRAIKDADPKNHQQLLELLEL